MLLFSKKSPSWTVPEVPSNKDITEHGYYLWGLVAEILSLCCKSLHFLVSDVSFSYDFSALWLCHPLSLMVDLDLKLRKLALTDVLKKSLNFDKLSGVVFNIISVIARDRTSDLYSLSLSLSLRQREREGGTDGWTKGEERGETLPPQTFDPYIIFL